MAFALGMLVSLVIFVAGFIVGAAYWNVYSNQGR